MDDRIDVKAVEFQVDDTGKVWLNVNGVCVFRAGHSQCVVVDLPRIATPERRQVWSDHIVLAFPKADPPPDWKQDKSESSKLPRGDHHEY